ncbi:hypothetical protein MKK50_15115 [Methylobacterium sp. J-043]|nr:hypothetical protein [Methylobacterium sp. J-043]
MAYQVTGGGRPATLYASADAAVVEALVRIEGEPVAWGDGNTATDARRRSSHKRGSPRIRVDSGHIWAYNEAYGRWVLTAPVAKLLGVLGQGAGMNGVRIISTAPPKSSMAIRPAYHDVRQDLTH